MFALRTTVPAAVIAGLALLTVALPGGATHVAAAPAANTFDSDSEGWTIVGDPADVLKWEATGGNPGGNLRWIDPGQGKYTYWVAPDMYHGDLSGSFGSTLAFDQLSNIANNRSPDGRDVLLTGGGIALAASAAAPTRSWTTATVALVPASFVVLPAGTPATAADLMTVLANVTDLRVRAEWTTFADDNRLDNVRIGGPPEYVSLVPGRLLESRSGEAPTVDGQSSGIGVRTAGSVTELQIGGRYGIPANANAVVLNVTAVDAQGSGFVTVFPCGAARPNASNVNYTAGAIIPNAVVAKLGTDGKVCLFTYAATQLVVDVNGYYPAQSTFVPLVPGRLLESRSGEAPTVDGQSSGIGVRTAGSVTELQIADGTGSRPTRTRWC